MKLGKSRRELAWVLLMVTIAGCAQQPAGARATPTVVPYDGTLSPLEFVNPDRLPVTYEDEIGSQRVTLNADGSGEVENLQVWVDCATTESFVADGAVAWGMPNPVSAAIYYPERGLAQYVGFLVDLDGNPAITLEVPACDGSDEVLREFRRVPE